VRVVREEPEIKWAAESLVRLGAVGSAPVFGTDLTRGQKALKKGWGRCTEKERIIPGEFLGRTVCRSSGPKAVLRFHVDAPSGATVILRARHLLRDEGLSVPLSIRVDGVEVAVVELTGKFQEARMTVAGSVWAAGEHKIDFNLGDKGKFELDHFLVVANRK
jgi:hypothetical protein